MIGDQRWTGRHRNQVPTFNSFVFELTVSLCSVLSSFRILLGLLEYRMVVFQAKLHVSITEAFDFTLVNVELLREINSWQVYNVFLRWRTIKNQVSLHFLVYSENKRKDSEERVGKGVVEFPRKWFLGNMRSLVGSARDRGCNRGNRISYAATA